MPTDPNLELIYRLTTDPALSYGVQAHMEAMGKRGDQVIYRLAQYDPDEHKNGNGNGGGLFINALTIVNTQWPETVWAVPGIIPAGLSFLAARPKFGKSWFMLQVSFAKAAGGKLFNREVKPGRVLYCALEDNEMRLKSRLLKQGWTREAMQNTEFILLRSWLNNIGALNNGGADKLAHHIDDNKFELVVIDTFSRAIKGDHNDNDDMTQQMSPVQMVAQENNCAVVFIDHHKKGASDYQDPIDDVMGSTGKVAVADTIMGFYRERGKPGAKLRYLGRDVEDTTLDLFFDKITGCWQLDQTGQASLTGIQIEIMDAFANVETPARLKAILAVMGIDEESNKSKSVRDNLIALEKAGKVRITHEIYRGQPVMVYAPV